MSSEAPDTAADEEAGAEPVEPPEIPPSVLNLRRTRKTLWIAVAVALPVAMLIAVLATSPSARSRAVKSPLVGKPAPPVEGPTVDGSRASLADLRGRWVVVNFFATWCVPCRDDHPDLVRFAARHDSAGDAKVVGVVYDDSANAVRSFLAREGGTWPMLQDPQGRIALDFGVSGVPESYIVSPDGIVAAKVIGGIEDGALEALLQRIRSGSPARG